MKRLAFGICAALLGACGPSLEADHVKTPDEILAEQEQLAAEQEKKGRQYDRYTDENSSTDEEKQRQWDPEYAELELRRASRSAETCLEAVAKQDQAQKGKAQVKLIFQNDGNVKEATVGAPYTDTVVGKCVLNAMGKAIVKTYEGPEKTIEWEVDLTGEKKSGPIGGSTASSDE